MIELPKPEEPALVATLLDLSVTPDIFAVEKEAPADSKPAKLFDVSR